MARKCIASIQELGEAFRCADLVSDDSVWGPFNRIFRVSMKSSKMAIPKTFETKLTRWFHLPGDKNEEDSIERAELQTVVRVFDRWTCNQTCFNAARALKPLNNGLRNSEIQRDGIMECDFCSAKDFTAADLWGRLENASGLTASNVAKYDALHSMVVFKEHSPSHYTKTKLYDMLDLCSQWFEITHKHNPQAIYPIMNWNCRARAGASQHHGHSHMLLAENFHYGQWEHLKQAAKFYSLEYPGHNYFNDFVTAHINLGLAKRFGDACVLAHIVPYCGYEFKAISWNFGDDFKLAINEAVNALINQFGSESYNLCIHFPPLQNGKLRAPMTPAEIKNHRTVDNVPMPFIAHLVDRGDTKNSSSDVCGMRIYGSSMVNEDPFVISKELGWLKH